MDSVTWWTAVEVPGRLAALIQIPPLLPGLQAVRPSLIRCPLINERESNLRRHRRCPRLDSSLQPKKVVTTGLAAESY